VSFGLSLSGDAMHLFERLILRVDVQSIDQYAHFCRTVLEVLRSRTLMPGMQVSKSQLLSCIMLSFA
jgi:hypothetical protein